MIYSQQGDFLQVLFLIILYAHAENYELAESSPLAQHIQYKRKVCSFLSCTFGEYGVIQFICTRL